MNKVGTIDPACRPPRSQRIPHKPGNVVVQMVVVLPSLLTRKPVLASFFKGGSNPTLSVSDPSGLRFALDARGHPPWRDCVEAEPRI